VENFSISGGSPINWPIFLFLSMNDEHAKLIGFWMKLQIDGRWAKVRNIGLIYWEFVGWGFGFLVRSMGIFSVPEDLVISPDF
jgi:hypothetical protein